jgi:2-(1,2-epoxy-1,2-dihydrophenyl)acetyl-CoA isomerase
MSASLVQMRREGELVHVALARPERHNSLVPELLESFAQVLRAVRAAPPAVLILSAKGRSFSTGGDVRGFYEAAREQRTAYARRVVGGLNEVILDLLRLPCPSIVLVHGPVTGGSLGLVLACDIAIAGPRASFASWYVDVGFSPDGGWTALLPERIGRARAREVQLLNRTLAAEEALACGLIQELVAEAQLEARAAELAGTLAGKKRGSIRHTLSLCRPEPDRVAAALEAERRHFLEQIVSDEADAGMARFLRSRTGG